MADMGTMPDDEAIARIKLDLDNYEGERKLAHRQVSWRVPVFVGATAVAIAALAWAFNTFADPSEQWLSAPHIFLYVLGFVGIGFAYSRAIQPAKDLQQSFRDRVLPIALGFIENVIYSKGYVPDSFDRLPKEAVGTFNRQTFDDVFTGTYDGFPFELYEATLNNKAGKSESTVFKGVIVAFEPVVSFPGLLVATRKTGQVARFFRDMFGGSDLVEISSGVDELDMNYDFHTDNPEAAEPLVTGRMARALVWMAGTWPDEPARIALNGRDGFLLIPLKQNFFELPDIGTPLDYREHIGPIIADMVSLLATASLVRQVGTPDDRPANQPGATS